MYPSVLAQVIASASLQGYLDSYSYWLQRKLEKAS